MQPTEVMCIFMYLRRGKTKRSDLFFSHSKFSLFVELFPMSLSGDSPLKIVFNLFFTYNWKTKKKRLSSHFFDLQHWLSGYSD